MTITKENAINVTNILSGMTLNKISDKDVKNALVWNYIVLRKIARETNTDTQEVITKFQEDWKDAIAPVRAFRDAKKPVVGYDDFLSAEKDATNTIATIMQAEVDANVKVVALDKFVNAVSNEEISFEQVAFLQDCGIIN